MVSIKGGDIAKAYLEKIAAAVSEKAVVDVGFLEGATYPDGTSVPLVAALNEFGTGKQPPRPFMQIAVTDRSGAWAINTGIALKRNNFNAGAALALVGQGMKEDIEDSIRKLVSPPLAESTIARKSKGTVKKIKGVLGPAKPLIETAHMLNSVGVRLKMGDK